MPKFKSDKKYYIIFVIVSFIFLLTESSMNVFDYLYKYGYVFGIISAASFITYAFFYVLGIRRKRAYSKILTSAFIIILINFIAILIFSGQQSNAIFYYDTYILYVLAINLVLMISTGMVIFLGAYLVRDKASKNSVYFGYAIIAIAVALIFVYFVLVIKYYTIDDEIFIAITSIKYLFLNGANPYQHSLSQLLYYNSSLAFTMTTNNQIIGTLNYPALYLLSYLPFYFLAPPTIYNLEHYIAPMQAAVFLAAMLLIIGFSIDKEHLKLPPIGVFIVLAIFVVSIASFTSFLMLALLVLAYKKSGTKYSWLLFGMCLAIQELLWLPIILLFVYSIRNYGTKKGFYDIMLSILVFLVINSYFIALSPSAFLGSISNPLQKLLLPTGDSPVSFSILSNYGILLSTYTILFGIAAIFVVLLFAYINEKALVGLLAMVPFLFLAHTLSAYYAFFIAFLFVSLFIKENKQDIKAKKHASRRDSIAYVALGALLLALFAYVLINSHASYIRNFNIGISNQSIYYDKALNKTVYTGTLRYSNLSQRSMYILFFGRGNSTMNIIGVVNYSIINNSVKCGNDFQCLLNVNKITLYGSSGNYTLMAYIGSPNTTKVIRNARLFVYSGQYVYVASPVSNSLSNGR